jgi:hypothetical protein
MRTKRIKKKQIETTENMRLTRISFPLGRLGNGELAKLTCDCLAQLANRITQRQGPPEVALLAMLTVARQLIRCDRYDDEDE